MNSSRKHDQASDAHRPFLNVRPLILLAGVALAFAGWAVLFFQTQPGPAPAPAAAAGPSFSPADPPPPAPQAELPAQPARSGPFATPAPEPRLEAASSPPADWEVKIDQILKAYPGGSDAANAVIAQMLVRLLPTLPPEGQVEAAAHISALTADRDYHRVMPLLRNPLLPEEARDALVTNLMNRGDAVKLPALLEIAKLPNHPYREKAQTYLQIFLDEEHGADWAKWDAAVKEHVRKLAVDEVAGAGDPKPRIFEPAAK